MMQITKERLLAAAFIFIALVILTMQNNLSFVFLFPILLATLVISWYLYKEIQKENEESLKRGIHYMQEETEAQVWLKKSFTPKAIVLAKKELKAIIIASGVVLLSFIFLWSFFISGLYAAFLNSILGLTFFVGFLLYTLYAPKEFTKVFKHVPSRYRHHSKNDWVHGYLLLFPFAALGLFFYSITTGESILNSLLGTVIYLFSFTVIFISIYCLWYLYQEYQKEIEGILKKEAKKTLRNK
jgi:Ca2+/Na+ antiporter